MYDSKDDASNNNHTNTDTNNCSNMGHNNMYDIYNHKDNILSTNKDRLYEKKHPMSDRRKTLNDVNNNNHRRKKCRFQ